MAGAISSVQNDHLSGNKAADLYGVLLKSLLEW